MQEVKSRSGARFKGIFELECYDKDGNFKWYEKCENIFTDEGLDHILDSVLHGADQNIPTWYCFISESNEAPAAGMTYLADGVTETEAYIEGTRPEYDEAAASSQSTTNSSNKAVFSINDTKTLEGAGLKGGGTNPTVKGDTAGGGTLLNYAKFAASRGVVEFDVVNLTVTIGAADDEV